MQFYGIEKRLGRKVYFVLQGLLSCAHCYGVGAAFRCSRMLFILSSATQGQCICNNCHVWGGSHFAFLERLHRGVEGREHFCLHALIGIYVWESQVQKRKLIKQKQKKPKHWSKFNFFFQTKGKAAWDNPYSRYTSVLKKTHLERII